MKIYLQLAGIFALCICSEGIAALLPFAFPGSAVAMLLLFLAFLFKLVRPSQIQETSQFLLENMAVFFVPAGVGLLECFGKIQHAIIPILVICIVTTVLTFAATAYTVRLVVYLQTKYRERRGHCE